MKRIWFGAGLLVFLLVLGICGSFFMEQVCLAQTQKLDRAADLASNSDWAAARALTAQARQEWSRRQVLFSAFCDHAPLDQIEGLFSQLETFSAVRSAASFSSTCVYLARQIESLGRSHSFTLENFL